jgi:imidazolonepropionase-like amidohydrolase
LSSSEILAAATASTADAFRLGDRGRILPGRRADLLLIRGDPTSDVLAIRDIVRVWKSGVEVDRMVSGRSSAKHLFTQSIQRLPAAGCLLM